MSAFLIYIFGMLVCFILAFFFICCKYEAALLPIGIACIGFLPILNWFMFIVAAIILYANKADIKVVYCKKFWKFLLGPNIIKQ